MTRRDFITGGLKILGVAFALWGALFLVHDLVGYAYGVVRGNPETWRAHFAPDFHRAILLHVLSVLSGIVLIAKAQVVVRLVDRGNGDN